MIVALHGAEFYAYHGFYPEEQKIGNHFVVDIEIEFMPTENVKDDNIEDTVNYEWLYDMVCEEMKLTKKLIETVAHSIIERSRLQYPFAERIELTLKKLNPLVGAKTQYSSVALRYHKSAGYSG